MSRKVKPEGLAVAIQQELEEWEKDVKDRVNDAGLESIDKLVKLTKASAPKKTGKFRRAITSEENTNAMGMKTFTWGAKAPSHRVTHLLVHGHANRGGGRTPGNSFLESSLNTVLPEYEKAVKEAVEK